MSTSKIDIHTLKGAARYEADTACWGSDSDRVETPSTMRRLSSTSSTVDRMATDLSSDPEENMLEPENSTGSMRVPNFEEHQVNVQKHTDDMQTYLGSTRTTTGQATKSVTEDDTHPKWIDIACGEAKAQLDSRKTLAEEPAKHQAADQATLRSHIIGQDILIGELKNARDTILEACARYEKLKKESEEARAALHKTMIERDAESAETIKKLLTERDQVSANLSLTRTHLERTKTQHYQAQSTTQKLQAYLDDTTKELNHTEEVLKDTRHKLSNKETDLVFAIHGLKPTETNLKVHKIICDTLDFSYKKLQSAHEELKKKHYILSYRFDNLEKEHGRLQISNQTFNREHCKLEYEHEDLKIEHGELRTEHEALKNEHRNLQTTYSTLTAAHARLETEHESLRSRHADLQRTNNALTRAQEIVVAKSTTTVKSLHRLVRLWDDGFGEESSFNGAAVSDAGGAVVDEDSSSGDDDDGDDGRSEGWGAQRRESGTDIDIDVDDDATIDGSY